jgi:hypothetical protein
MRQHRPLEIEDRHLDRLALVFVRQSCRPGVEEQTGSTGHQRDQREFARHWGWPEEAIEVIDDDLGLSGASGNRPGFQRLQDLVAQKQAGMILASDASRLTRSRSDLESLLRLCRDAGTLLALNGSIVVLDTPREWPDGLKPAERIELANPKSGNSSVERTLNLRDRVLPFLV